MPEPLTGGLEGLGAYPEPEVVPEEVASDAQPVAVPEGAVPVEPTEEEKILWRWRNNEREIPRRVVKEMATALDAPSEEALVQWTQQGRDYNYWKSQLDQDRESFEEERRQLRAKESMVDNIMRQIAEERSLQEEYPSEGPRARNGAAPPRYEMPSQVDVNDPKSVLNVIASLPATLTQLRSEMLSEIRRDRIDLRRREAEYKIAENAVVIQNEAESFVKEMKDEGWDVPDQLNPERLVQECTRLGLSQNPAIPWREAFETAFAKMVYRHGLRLGARNMATQLTTNRKAEFRTPPSKPVQSQTTLPKDSLLAKVEAAKKIGANVRMSDAVNDM